MAVKHDATTTDTVSAVASRTVSHPVGNGDSRILIVTAVAENTVTPANTPVVSITYAGQPLTKVNNQSFSGGNENVEQWYLLNPPVGTWDCVVTWTGSCDVGVIVSSYFNVAQRGPEDNNIATGTGLAFSANALPTSNQALVYSSLMDQSSSSTLTLDAGPTQRANVTFAGFFKEGSAETIQAGAPSVVTHSWTSGASHTWGMVCAAYGSAPPKPLGARLRSLRPAIFKPGRTR